MKINEYQEEAIKTAVYGEGQRIIYPTLGLTGEAGEVAEKVKKVLRDNAGVFTDEQKLEIAKEISDVLWYCATLARDIGYTLEQIAEINLQKLRSRQERGVISGSGDNR
jgi:NTP pyrophosphatase (non-canonical NTP hydrolase)